MSLLATIAVAVAALVAALVALVLWVRLRKTARAHQGAQLVTSAMMEALGASGMGALIWPRSGEGGRKATAPRPDDPGLALPGLSRLFAIPGDREPGLQDLCGRFTDASTKALTEAVARLRTEGDRFELELENREGRAAWRATGHRAALDAREADIVVFRGIRAEAAETDAMRARIASLRGLLDAVPVPLWSRGPDLKLQEINAAYARAVEAASREEAIEASREFAGGGLSSPGLTLAKNARETGIAQKIRQHVVVEGERRLYEINEGPLDGNGRLAGFALDLTGIEEAEGSLNRHINAHGEVLEKLGTAIVIYGPDQKLAFYNRAFVDLWGLDEAWLKGGPGIGEVLETQRERRLLPETADFPAFKAERVKHFTSLIEPLEELLHLPNGTALRQVITPHPLGGLLYTFEDVTDRLALERSFNTLTDVQRETIDNLAEGVAVFGEDGRLKLYNDKLAKLWNFTPEMLDGEPHVGELVEQARPIFPPTDDWEASKARTIDMVAGREERTGQFTTADGHKIEFGMIPLPDGGTLVRNIDITDKSRVEEALRERAEALEQADRLKSEFIANVSYELRTPLNTIIGFTEILDNEYFGALSARQKEYSSGVLEASQRLLTLINDILELASIEAGRVALKFGPVDAKDMAESVQTLSRQSAREKQLDLVLQCADDLGTLQADERRLKHALFNVVSNAIKFTPAGGTVTMSARRDEGAVVFSVTDTGIGISKDERARVFEKFVRGPDADGRQVGVGLGLSLVKSLIELHHGTVSIESVSDQGTTVICRIPERAVDGDAPETPEAPEPERASA